MIDDENIWIEKRLADHAKAIPIGMGLLTLGCVLWSVSK